MKGSSATINGHSRHPTLFVEGVRLSPGQESVLVALDYLDAVPRDPQEGQATADIALQGGITPHVARARLVELRTAGFVQSGECPRYKGEPLADTQTRHAHFLTTEGHWRSRWAIVGRRMTTDGQIGDQEHRLLARLYLAEAVPTDRLAQDRRALDSIGSIYRAKTEQQVSDAELVRYMIRSRKQGDWPRLGRALRGVFANAANGRMTADDLATDEREILVDIYRDLGRSCDATLTSAWHGRALARAFEEATGSRHPVRVLVDTLLAARKAGELPRLRPSAEPA